MPAFHVPCMDFKVGSFLIEMIIKLKVKMMSLKIDIKKILGTVPGDFQSGYKYAGPAKQRRL